MNIKYYRCNYPSYTLRHYKCRSNQHDNNMGVYFMTMLYLIVTIQMIYAANTADAGRLLNATTGGYGRFFFFSYLYFKCMFNAFRNDNMNRFMFVINCFSFNYSFSYCCLLSSCLILRLTGFFHFKTT